MKFARLIVALACASITFCCIAQNSHHPTVVEARTLQKFLEDHKRDLGFPMSGPLQYKSVFVDLKDDGTFEALVYITDPAFCGSGGCDLMVLAPAESSYRLVTRTSVTWPPIRVLRSKTNGWHDIAVLVAGGGIQPGYEARLKFDGKSYPSNPTAPPAQPLESKVSGRVLISSH